MITTPHFSSPVLRPRHCPITVTLTPHVSHSKTPSQSRNRRHPHTPRPTYDRCLLVRTRSIEPPSPTSRSDPAHTSTCLHRTPTVDAAVFAAPPSMPLPNLPPYSLQNRSPRLTLVPIGGTFVSSEPPPHLQSQPPITTPTTASHLIRGRRPLITRIQNPPRNQPPRRRVYLRHETLLLAVLLVLQLAVLVILGTVVTHSDWRRCGDGPGLPTHSTGLEDVVSQASSDNSQSTTPEP